VSWGWSHLDGKDWYDDSPCQSLPTPPRDPAQRDGTASGTLGLKALANQVIDRDTGRDSARDTADPAHHGEGIPPNGHFRHMHGVIWHPADLADGFHAEAGR
jgi:hypothetical protein